MSKTGRTGGWSCGVSAVVGCFLCCFFVFGFSCKGKKKAGNRARAAGEVWQLGHLNEKLRGGAAIRWAKGPILFRTGA